VFTTAKTGAVHERQDRRANVLGQRRPGVDDRQQLMVIARQYPHRNSRTPCDLLSQQRPVAAVIGNTGLQRHCESMRGPLEIKFATVIASGNAALQSAAIEDL
jgi:hypothetical protein